MNNKIIKIQTLLKINNIKVLLNRIRIFFNRKVKTDKTCLNLN